MILSSLALLFLLLMMALWTVMTSNLLKSAIALALTSVVLTLLMFTMNAPLAGVFELSICAGLITVVFVSAISLTKPLPDSELQTRRLARLKRFIWLPILLIAVSLALYHYLPLPQNALLSEPTHDVRTVLWSRQFDLVGQILIILAGIFGIVVLFKEIINKPDPVRKEDLK